MADRDALIVICWLVILVLVFFECFQRKLKARFGRDIRPPQNTRQSLVASPSDAVTVNDSSSFSGPHFGGSFRRGELSPGVCRNYNIIRGARFAGPITISTSTSPNIGASSGRTKEVCRITMMSMINSYESIEEEEPPPTYEEAISYERLLSKYPLTLNDEESTTQHSENGFSGGEVTTHNSVDTTNYNGIRVSSSNATNNLMSPSAASTSRATTTAIFVDEDESEDDHEDEDSSSNQSVNHSSDEEELDIDSNNNDNLTLDEIESVSLTKCISRDDNIINKNEQRPEQVQCNMNVILTSSSSTSKNLDIIVVECNEKIRFCSGDSNSEKLSLQYSPNQKPFSSSSSENIV